MLFKLLNIPIIEMKAEIKILKHMSDVPSGVSIESIYVWLDWLKESGRYDIIFGNRYVFNIKNVYHNPSHKFRVRKNILQIKHGKN